MSIIKKVKSIIFEKFKDEPTGHDWYHIERVLTLSKYLQSKEGGNLKIIELSALLHDISDYKFNGGQMNKGGEVAYSILTKLECDKITAKKVKYIVDNISYKGAKVDTEMKSLEGKIVQDADRLDAIGAIGIARTFAYGGNKNQPIHDPNLKSKKHNSFEEYANSKTSSINHFYEKLLLLKSRFNTVTAKKIAEHRHQYMKKFLDEFFHEWNFTSKQSKYEQ